MSLYVNKDNIDSVEVTYVGDLDPGVTFVGTVEDAEGNEQSGVFLVLEETVVLLDDCSVVFQDFDRHFGDSQVVNGYREVDATLTVDGYTDNN